MATAKELSEQISDITECSICSESFKEPKVLPCIHTFCLHCLEKYGQEKEKEPGDKVDCPLCRKMFTIPQTGFNGLPNNYFIIQLLQVSLQQPGGGGAEKNGVQCELCVSVSQVRPAAAYCIECGQHLCEKCIGRHKMLKVTKMHKVVNLDEKPAAEELMKMMPSYCEQHPMDEIKFYCYDCNKTFCMVCYVDKHNTHKCSDVKKSAKEFRVHLNEDISKLCTAKSQEELKELNEEKSKFVTKVEVTGREIGERYSKLRAMLDKHQKQLMEELKSYQAKRLKEIETRKDEVERMFLTKESFKRYCTEMNEKGTSCEISRAAKDLHTRTEELVKTEAELIGKKLPSAEITLMPSTMSTANAKNWIGELSYKTVKDNTERSVDLLRGVSDDFCSTSYLDQSSTTVHAIPGEGRVDGIAVVDNELFIVRHRAVHVEVYDTKIFASTPRQLKISELTLAYPSICACSHYNCLYVSAYKEKEVESIVHRVDLSNSEITIWKVHRGCRGLSVTKNYNLLVTLPDSRRVHEYTTRGTIIKEISLDRSIDHPLYCVELSTGNFVICHMGSTVHRVCIVDASGIIIKSYGGAQGSGIEQLNWPCQLSVDKYDKVFVSDYHNNRVQLLSPRLSHCGIVHTPGYKLVNPYALHLDEINGRLFVGERLGRVLVIEASVIKLKPNDNV